MSKLRVQFTSLLFGYIITIFLLPEFLHSTAAMTAYVRIQFTEMGDIECDRVATALLKYCELETLAMVMIYEYWRVGIRKSGRLTIAA